MASYISASEAKARQEMHEQAFREREMKATYASPRMIYKGGTFSGASPTVTGSTLEERMENVEKGIVLILEKLEEIEKKVALPPIAIKKEVNIDDY